MNIKKYIIFTNKKKNIIDAPAKLASSPQHNKNKFSSHFDNFLHIQIIS